MFIRPTHWRILVQDIEVLTINSSALGNSKVMTPETLLQLILDDRVSEGKKSELFARNSDINVFICWYLS
ncbi:hypothetical protein Hanom_Chr10g00912991 [Helianthus anomalus]